MRKLTDFYAQLSTLLVSFQVMDDLGIEIVIANINSVDTLLIRGKDQVDGGVILGLDDFAFTQHECDMLLKVLDADVLKGLMGHRCFTDNAYVHAYVFDKASVGLIGLQFRVFRFGEYSLYWNPNLKKFAHLNL